MEYDKNKISVISRVAADSDAEAVMSGFGKEAGATLIDAPLPDGFGVEKYLVPRDDNRNDAYRDVYRTIAPPVLVEVYQRAYRDFVNAVQYYVERADRNKRALDAPIVRVSRDLIGGRGVLGATDLKTIFIAYDLPDGLFDDVLRHERNHIKFPEESEETIWFLSGSHYVSEGPLGYGG